MLAAVVTMLAAVGERLEMLACWERWEASGICAAAAGDGRVRSDSQERGTEMGKITLWDARDLAGTVVAVTGGTSGIGRAACRILAESGDRVVVTGRRVERLEQIVAELGDDVAVGYDYDVRDVGKADGMVHRAMEAFGRFDSLVAAAGFGGYGSIMDYTNEFLNDMIVTNIFGTLWPVRAAVKHFLHHGGGDIVIVASVAGLRSGANEAVYGATKFAQVGLAGALDRELTPKNIRATAICPAGVQTEFALGHGRVEGDPALKNAMVPEDVASAILTVLAQPRRLRTSVWTLWSMGEQN